jgi:hypothetical protein
MEHRFAQKNLALDGISGDKFLYYSILHTYIYLSNCLL